MTTPSMNVTTGGRSRLTTHLRQHGGTLIGSEQSRPAGPACGLPNFRGERDTRSMASVLDASSSRVIGREPELATIREFVVAMSDGPRTLLLDGAAGIGKTTLWRAGLRAAEEQGHLVLCCRPAELESRLAFGAVIDLFAEVGEEVLARLPPPQQHALAVALLRREPGSDDAVQPRETAVGALAVIRALARSTPVLIAIDDAQWLDAPSARVLAYALRRLAEEPVGVLATRRKGTSSRVAFEQLRPDEEITRAEIPPLTLGALHHLVRERLRISLPRPTLTRLLRTSGGNPFFALEVLRSLGRELPDSVAELSIPGRLRGLVAERLAALPAAAREAVLACFALSRPTPAAIESALQAARRSQRGLAAALEADALELRHGLVQLGHPLIGSILYDELTTTQRRALHARLAGISRDHEEQARHRALAASAPDAAVADLLESAAGSARSRGAPDASAELLELAIALTPAHDEDDRTHREFALAQDLYVVGEMARARERWRKLAQYAAHAVDRARARCDLVRFVEANRRKAERLLGRALAEAEGDLALQATIELAWARVGWWSGRLRIAEEHANAAVALAEQTQDPIVLPQALAQAAVVAFHRGRPEWAAIIERGVAIEREIEHELPLDVLPRMHRALIWERAGDDVHTTRRYLHELRAAALKHGDQSALANLGFWFTWNECAAGNLELAASYAREGVACAAEVGAVHLNGAYKHAFALIDSLAGRSEDAIAGASEALALSANLVPIVLRSRATLGFVELLLAHPKAALSWLEPARQLYADEGWGELGRFVPDLVESLILLGRLDEADARLSSFEAGAQELGRRWALGESKRCRGLLLAAQGRLDDAEAAVRSAVRLSEELGQPLHFGRALLVQGVVARRAKHKREADASLARAQSVFERAGMKLLAERARAERARVGLRPRAPSDLTETEQRVAELAASGQRNSEIATELFMSVSAVEANLTRAYRKLGIRSRSELALRLPSVRSN